ncbi:zinc metalloprotease [Bacteroidia bacterium]|nr:zinc metalloprotease [Bacteroidia bacterium]
MTGLIMTVQLLLGLSILVFLHELGHYLTAKMFGIKVEKFYLFFDAWGGKLMSFEWHGTEFGIGWLPFGGYCKIAGMVDESMDTAQLACEPQAWEFRAKPAWQRLIVICAGVIMNLITGIFIMSCLLLSSQSNYLSNDEVSQYGIYASPIARELHFQTGDKIVQVNGKTVKRFQDVQSLNVLLGATITVVRGQDTLNIVVPDDTYKRLNVQRGALFEPFNYPMATIDSIYESSIAQRAGLQKNDLIIAVAGDSVRSFGAFRDLIWQHRAQEIVIDIVRNNVPESLTVKLDSTGYLGIQLGSYPYQLASYTISSALFYGTKDAFDLILANARGLGKIFTGKEKAQESLQGPVGMARIYGGQWVWTKFWYITALISLILAFMNILPIPALDGGHLVFILAEIITRRKPSIKVLTVAQTIGMMLLLGIMIFAIGNDIIRLF